MVKIYSTTTTTLTSDFVSKIPANILSTTIENLNSIVDISLSKGVFTLKGDWEDLYTAYTLLKDCLKVKKNKNNHARFNDIIVDEISEINDGTKLDTKNDVKIKNEKPEDTLENETGPGEVLKVKKEITDGGPILDADETTQNIDFEEEKEEPENISEHQCSKCDYTGKNERQLFNHINRVHQRKYKCNECGKKFGYKGDLKRHHSEVHSSKERYFCKICNKYLKTKTYIDDHMQLHKDNYVYHCKICEKSFSTKGTFSKHMKLKHPKSTFDEDMLNDVLPETNDENIKQTEGDMEIENGKSDDKNSEVKDEHLNESVKFRDSFQMLLSDDENESSKTVHDGKFFKVSLKKGKNRGRPRIKSQVDGRTEFPCHLCEYIGKRECHLEYHIKRNHSQKLVCDVCNKQFGYNWDLKRHREQVHAEASYFCHICSKAYKVKKSFDEHLKSHEDGYVKSRFPCPMCEKSFSAKQVLENHMKYKHLGAKQKEKQRYLCQTCGQEFYHKYSYQSHMNKHAGLMPYNCDIVHKNTRNFTCAYCPKSFKTSSALKAHEAIHVGEKSYKCSVCGKGFVQKQSLLRHERIHSGYKPYKCLLCARRFTDSATVRKHMILVHKKDPHNWQGDVVSDLKKNFEFWREDEESDSEKSKAGPSDSHESREVREATYSGEVTSAYTNPQSYTDIHVSNSAHHNLSTDLSHSQMSHMAMLQNVSGSMAVNHQGLPPTLSVPLRDGNAVNHMNTSHNTHNPHISHNTQLSVAHNPTHSTAAEMAAASILNLSSHLPPLTQTINHLSSMPSGEGQMPPILNLTTMPNMSYSHSQSTQD
ncbi:ZN878-like protein [Mya arenaria]|uniref:ZN878-like protein n=1 Tax=Mya arenaria TaxID=6604 RepID=A0ABY7DQS2_MYAAR|nr:ZN878-like protein [Mya arenaria]